MDFGQALQELKLGKKIARSEWVGAGLWLKLEQSDENTRLKVPYIAINYPKYVNIPSRIKIPVLSTQTDLLENDWVVVP